MTPTPTMTPTVVDELASPVLAGTVRAGSRLDRLTHPRARDLVTRAAVEAGVCIRPVLLRSTDLVTGETRVVTTPCGSTRAAVCPACADKARRVRAQQCREGWHIDDEPDLTPRPPTPRQKDLIEERARATADLDNAAPTPGKNPTSDDPTSHDPGPGTGAADPVDRAQELAGRVAELDEEIASTGARGVVVPAVVRRKRSTRRRDDVPDLPRRTPLPSTLGRTYTDTRTGRTFRPSLFVTLTLPSYGKVDDHGNPTTPGSYDYRRAARDALHFGKLLDRWFQNLRRVAGYDIQYFAAVEPQRRGAPHVHFAIRGTLPRAVVRELTAATYATIWWPPTDRIVYGGGHLPVWDDDHGGYLDPDTRQPLPTWDEALDQLDADEQETVPRHTVRFGTQVDVKGVLAGSIDADRAIGYLVKYLVKDLGSDLTTDDTDPDDDGDDQADDEDQDDGRSRRWSRHRASERAHRARRADHITRLVDALHLEPCSPRCPNWLAHGIQPDHPRPGQRPGCCRAKAHRPSHLGYGGRRVLTSRKWTGKDLRDHRHDRHDHVRAVLTAAGIDPDTGHPRTHATTDANDRSATGKDGRPRLIWELARPTDPDVKPRHHRLLTAIADAHRRRTQYRAAARDHSGTPVAQPDPMTAPGGSAA